ncbi:MAG: hypothetical protein EXS09_09795 [Gemmataceae bacterium]|nr:hypothetical protein [Gemmataceae bacterium]
MKSAIVAKVGGSLFDLPDLRERLLAWVKQQRNCPILFVPGGGEAADVVRKLDNIHRLGEEKSHWLAIRMMSANAYFLATLLGVPTTASPHHWSQDAPSGAILVPPTAILDTLRFCESDLLLEHSWQVSSDSIAARVAIALQADLILLKSVDMPPGKSWRDTAEAGLLDHFFSTLVENSGLNVTWVNLRSFEATPRQ